MPFEVEVENAFSTGALTLAPLVSNRLTTSTQPACAATSRGVVPPTALASILAPLSVPANDVVLDTWYPNFSADVELVRPQSAAVSKRKFMLAGMEL
jgi:hypothetical protein